MTSAQRQLGLLLPVVLVGGCGSLGEIDYIDLLTGGRDGWQRPAEVVETLALEPGDRVAEIGAGEIDLAMTCLTYHHISDREPYFANLRRDLAPGGRVVHLDDHDDVPLPIRWKQGEHVSDPEAIVAEMAEAGYVRTGAWDFLPFMSFQQFEPTAELGAAR